MAGDRLLFSYYVIFDQNASDQFFGKNNPKTLSQMGKKLIFLDSKLNKNCLAIAFFFKYLALHQQDIGHSLDKFGHLTSAKEQKKLGRQLSLT